MTSPPQKHLSSMQNVTPEMPKVKIDKTVKTTDIRSMELKAVWARPRITTGARLK